MAYTYKDRRRGYDNIANGSAAGFEIHNAGAASHSESSLHNLDANTNTSTSALALGKRENVIRVPTSNDNVSIGGLDQSTDAAATSGWTSGTSRTSVFYEVVG